MTSARLAAIPQLIERCRALTTTMDQTTATMHRLAALWQTRPPPDPRVWEAWRRLREKRANG